MTFFERSSLKDCLSKKSWPIVFCINSFAKLSCAGEICVSARRHCRRAGHCGKSLRRNRDDRLNFQPPADLGQSLPHGYFSRPNELAAPFEIVIGEAGYVGLDHQVRRAAPEMAHLVLRDGKGLSDHVE